MMGTLAASLAGYRIRTSEDRYRAEAEGDIEDVDGVLKITTIRVKYYLKVPEGMIKDAHNSFETYLKNCPGAQSVIGCIYIKDELIIEESE